MDIQNDRRIGERDGKRREGGREEEGKEGRREGGKEGEIRHIRILPIGDSY